MSESISSPIAPIIQTGCWFAGDIRTCPTAGEDRIRAHDPPVAKRISRAVEQPYDDRSDPATRKLPHLSTIRDPCSRRGPLHPTTIERPKVERRRYWFELIRCRSGRAPTAESLLVNATSCKHLPRSTDGSGDVYNFSTPHRILEVPGGPSTTDFLACARKKAGNYSARTLFRRGSCSRRVRAFLLSFPS